MTPLRVLARLWLAEPDDDVLAALRDSSSLPAHVPAGGSDAARLGLAVAWLDLVGRRVPPHESVFVDPSAMLDAPATARFRATLAAAGWSPPPGLRVPSTSSAFSCSRLPTWASGEGPSSRTICSSGCPSSPTRSTMPRSIRSTRPPRACARRRARPRRPAAGRRPASGRGRRAAAASRQADVPRERQRRRRRGTSRTTTTRTRASKRCPSPAWPASSACATFSTLLYARDAGLYLTRDDVRACLTRLDLPVGLGDRRMMLRGAFEAAGRHDAVVPLLDALEERWAAARKCGTPAGCRRTRRGRSTRRLGDRAWRRRGRRSRRGGRRRGGCRSARPWARRAPARPR
ncbi:MAG: molecular chaperone TorD family protein [Anaerolineae bacterium]